MMKMYSIKDTVVGKFHTSQINLMNNDKEAERALREVGSSDNDLTRKAGDIQLWCIGSFDEKTGIVSENEPYLIGTLIDYMEVRKDNGNS